MAQSNYSVLSTNENADSKNKQHLQQQQYQQLQQHRINQQQIADDNDDVAEGSDVICLTTLATSASNENIKMTPSTNCNNVINVTDDTSNGNTSAVLAIRPTTPTPLKKNLFSKKPQNLNLKISPHSRVIDIEKHKPLPCENDTSAFSGAAPAGDATSANSDSTSSKSSSTTSSTSTFPHEQYKTVKKLNIAFDNLCFSARMGFFRREAKHILNGITGVFKSGELSAIVGPSGAGKSTCLNILSGYTYFGYTGDVLVNDHLRDLKAFKQNVAFITQDTSLQPYLTVKEAMHFSANLKIGSHMTKLEKQERVKKILEAIGMYDNRHTRTGKLSGGQKKRLSIALELVNNPPVLILDEPTTGLDSFTSNQCISLLKKLAMEGRTVICTIHQPSALTFEMFDHLYAIANGSCIYAGGTQNLVPFLADAGLHCPESYNPADYLMEIATDDYGPQNEKLIAKIENGRNGSYRQNNAGKKALQIEAMRKIDKMMASGLMTPVTAPVLSPTITSTLYQYAQSSSNSKYQRHSINSSKPPLTPIKEMCSRVGDSHGILNDGAAYHQQHSSDIVKNSNNKTKSKPKIQLETPNLCKSENIYATPFYRQLGILLVRTFLILWRDKSLSLMRLVIHFVTALMIGSIFYGIGETAENMRNSFGYCFYSIMFVMYCAFSAILVKFPLEFPIVSREHFNRWYSLRAYYVAITLADIPLQLLCTSIYVIISYIMTDQPRDIFRVVLFCFMVFLTALVGQSIGLAVGASLSIKLAAILGPFFICPFLAFSGYFLQEKHTPELLKWMFKVSFLKYSLDGSVLAIFGYDRPRLPCSEMYCHYSRPQIFLKEIDMLNANYERSILFLVLIFLMLRILAFYIMSFRLRLFR